ncbi:CDP-diacylglycerol--glycerol-3-phosphate 3-phosphatidyltransferase [Wolinella succinogenes]|uniref:CDP-diacylglycerol--glycerol-3-phosphate 3-phosphatidyltransferase n=1 Tax=Wolinella succinogenes (strain ATCC 29543 / DSM 1740 / CCUG 13145 / JCM 31913 / LMG 7466 / NCTC 11488 / FDC 602W) TaxID=273121 RepID=Q7M7L4_WOLSU|nr:CDP-diacylglycerol--glycerol-3-phosphate 3-phosphatidyltransferase [Wolinella succinogenes]NLU33554.1 CDP-diacylglycerol--glycerol-3-phosphate 3-phosphatidyltransferase [Wolinella succinogenes]CAE11211.1 CDP-DIACYLGLYCEROL--PHOSPHATIDYLTRANSFERASE [Wolinella succinogenes]VEG81377.1 CDP-diacylglycerol--glycerol-3-phosphate 3-phosphatidyltransferase [Wolinella succinogenes]HCZ17999.1 CDP-diacylglycerol--glycerol-3-phosphate 3-phosphatidyltransferase [Helicobacter sp.]
MRLAPNLLTLSRIVFSFLLLVVILYGGILFPPPIHPTWINYTACVLFLIASITDFFDGFIAREHQITSTFGEVFDPLADKMLMLAGFVGLLVWERANPWAVFLILSREFFITGLRVVAASQGMNVAASSLGKWKTGLQITAVAFLLMDYFPGEILLWLATLITLYSGYDYTKAYMESSKA